MYFAAYQGFIWNRTLQVVAGLGAGAFSIPGKAGPYTFYRRLTDAELRTLSALEVPTVSRELLPCPPEVMAAVDTVLSERGLSVSDFNLGGVRAAYFKSFYRRAIVVPHDLSAGPFLPDDLYPGHEKVRVSFFLPSGSYATMLLKALCGS